MANIDSLKIQIPSDIDGYILLQCHHCGEYFKIPSEYFNNDMIFHISCRSCGLSSKSYFAEDVISLVDAKVHNHIKNEISNFSKALERSSKGNIISFKTSGHIEKEYERPIRITIDNLTKVKLNCCNKYVKIRPLLKMTAHFCPYCGVIHFDNND